MQKRALKSRILIPLRHSGSVSSRVWVRYELAIERDGQGVQAANTLLPGQRIRDNINDHLAQLARDEACDFAAASVVTRSGIRFVEEGVAKTVVAPIEVHQPVRRVRGQLERAA